MHSFLDAKIMAKVLRQSLAARGIAVSHSDCLELIAHQFGFADWNTLAARITAAQDERGLALPEGWIVTGQTDLKNYRLGVDPSTLGVALIESRFGRESGVDLSGDTYAVLMQSIIAGPYRGGKIELSAEIKTEDADLGTIWLRVDGAPGRVLHFDNMMTRKRNGPLKGTKNWTERHVILEVLDEAASIHFGFLLQGYGRVRARAFRVEAAKNDAETTAGPRVYLPQPTNLDFSQTA